MVSRRLIRLVVSGATTVYLGGLVVVALAIGTTLGRLLVTLRLGLPRRIHLQPDGRPELGAVGPILLTLDLEQLRSRPDEQPTKT